MTTFALSQNEGQVNFNPDTDLLNIDTTSSSNLSVTQDGTTVTVRDEFGHTITLNGVTERQLSFGFNVTNSFDGTALVFGDNQVGTTGDDGPNVIQGTNIISPEPNFFGPPGFFGSPGGDQIYGLGGADVIFGGAGGDLIRGGAGSDLIYAGTGEDYVLPGTGNDTVFGGDGNDFISDNENAGGGGSDVLEGQAGNDTLISGLNGDDRLVGGDGNDVLFASRGSNLLEGDDGNDTITVGFTAVDGSDLNNSGGSDTILGGGGQRPHLRQRQCLPELRWGRQRHDRDQLLWVCRDQLRQWRCGQRRHLRLRHDLVEPLLRSRRQRRAERLVRQRLAVRRRRQRPALHDQRPRL